MTRLPSGTVLSPDQAEAAMLQFADDSTTVIKLMMGSLGRIALGRPIHGSASSNAAKTLEAANNIIKAGMF